MKKWFYIFFTGWVLCCLFACQPDEDDSKTEVRKNILGTWTCSESSQIYKSLTATYEVTITEDPATINGVFINNFYQLGNNIRVNALVDEYVLDIPSQSIEGGFAVKKGSGIIADNYSEITMTYEMDDGSGQYDNVRATYVRK